VQRDFRDWLKERVDGLYKSRRDFIRTAEPGADEDAAQAYLAKVLNGTRPPPLAKAAQWAEKLKLTKAEKQHFLDLAAIANLPPEARPRFVALLERLEALESALKEI
jgi:hypothetical protein